MRLICRFRNTVWFMEMSFDCIGSGMNSLEEFVVDLSLSEVERIEQLLSSHIPIQRLVRRQRLICRLVYVKRIHTLVENREIDTIRERILPMFEMISQDEQEMVIIEFVPVVVAIAKLFHEMNSEEAECLCGELSIPLLLSIASSRSDSVKRLKWKSSLFLERNYICLVRWF